MMATSPFERRPALRRAAGFTILELLIVLLIILALTATAIPVLAPALEGRRMREASRLTTAFFSGARDRAIRNGRPVGVMIMADPLVPEMATVLRMAEVPLPYSGPTIISVAQLQVNSVQPNGLVQLQVQLLLTPDVSNPVPADLPPGLVRSQDTIQFNYQGPIYTIIGPTDGDGLISGSSLTVEVRVDPGTIYDVGGTLRTRALPWPNSGFGQPVSYQIIRQPAPSTVTPLVLPEGIVVDLTASGGLSPTSSYYPLDPSVRDPFLEALRDEDAASPESEPLIIVFNSTGGLDAVFRWLVDPSDPNNSQWVRLRPDGAVHLLMGRRENVPLQPGAVVSQNVYTDPTDEEPTYLSNLWVSIHAQTGLITVSNMTQAVIPTSGTDPEKALSLITQSRRLAYEAHTLGGR
jgi:type II secretory pathway pseudopilin PulG